jgi:hypothetical protein
MWDTGTPGRRYNVITAVTNNLTKSLSPKPLPPDPFLFFENKASGPKSYGIHTEPFRFRTSRSPTAPPGVDLVRM